MLREGDDVELRRRFSRGRFETLLRAT